jgi:hypothetical protein
MFPVHQESSFTGATLSKPSDSCIKKLPYDLLKEIFSSLPTTSQPIFASACKEFHSVSEKIFQNQKEKLKALLVKALESADGYAMPELSNTLEKLIYGSLTYPELIELLFSHKDLLTAELRCVTDPQQLDLELIKILQDLFPSPSPILDLPEELLKKLPSKTVSKLVDMALAKDSNITWKWIPLLNLSSKALLIAVNQNGFALQYATEEQKNDPNIVLAAVKKNGEVLEYASESLKNDPNIVLAAVSNCGDAIKYASEELKNDHRIAFAAVKKDGYLLQYVPKNLQNEPQIVLAAVKQNGLALKYASYDLRNNPEIVKAALEQDCDAFKSASLKLRRNPELVSMSVQKNGLLLCFAEENLKDDSTIVLAAVKQNPLALSFASPRLKNNRSLVKIAVEGSPLALSFASPELQNDPELQAIVKKTCN